MSLNLKGQFKERKEFVKYFGLTGVRIVEDEEGNPIINPTNEVLAKHFEDFDTKADEREYIGKGKIGWGYTDLVLEGGKQRRPEKDYEQMSSTDKEDYVPTEEVNMAKIALLVEAIGTGVKKLITFRFFEGNNITKKGDKVKVFNRHGEFSYQDEEGKTPEFFRDGADDLVRRSPISRGHLDFEDFCNFVYAYSSLSKKSVALLDDIDLEEMFKGDFSGVENLFTAIHRDIVSESNVPLYGACVLFAVTNNDNTRGNSVQDYFHEFERYVMNEKGETNKEFSYIKKKVEETRKPVNGKVYSVESNGTFVGHNGIPPKELKEFKSEYMDKIKAEAISKANRNAMIAESKAKDEFYSASDDSYNFD